MPKSRHFGTKCAPSEVKSVPIWNVKGSTSAVGRNSTRTATTNSLVPTDVLAVPILVVGGSGVITPGPVLDHGVPRVAATSRDRWHEEFRFQIPGPRHRADGIVGRSGRLEIVVGTTEQPVSGCVGIGRPPREELGRLLGAFLEGDRRQPLPFRMDVLVGVTKEASRPWMFCPGSAGFEPEPEVPGCSLRCAPGLPLVGFKSLR